MLYDDVWIVGRGNARSLSQRSVANHRYDVDLAPFGHRIRPTRRCAIQSAKLIVDGVRQWDESEPRRREIDEHVADKVAALEVQDIDLDEEAAIASAFRNEG